MWFKQFLFVYFALGVLFYLYRVGFVDDNEDRGQDLVSAVVSTVLAYGVYYYILVSE